MELKESFDWYQTKSKGLGNRFVDEVEKTLKRIHENPNRYPDISKSVKRCLVSKFPFGVLYTVENDSIMILAIMHLKRKPFYWINRTK